MGGLNSMHKNTINVGNAQDVLKQYPDNCIDLTVTSPPYDSLRTYKDCSWDFDIFKSIADELYRVTADGGVVAWVVGDQVIKGSESGSSFRQALYFMSLGFKLDDTIIYQKNNFSNPSRTRYHQTFEYVFILCKGKMKTFNPIKDRKNIYVGQRAHGKNRTVDGWKENGSGVSGEYGMRHNVWKYTTGGGHMTKDKVAYEHPAIFPEDLARDIIISWSNEGDLVLDPMAGSGTTLKIALELKRDYIGIEIAQEYADIIKKRLNLET